MNLRATVPFLFAGALCAQTPAKPQMVEEVFKNVRSLKGISVNEFMSTMGFFSASLGKNCTYCHVDESGGSWERYADDIPSKVTARRMIAMVAGINKTYFAGRRVLTCYSCHRGGQRPLVTPSLAEMYSAPAVPEPDQLAPGNPDAPMPEQILDKYIQALGGPQKLAAVTSFTAKGTVQPYASPVKDAMELFAKAPAQRRMIIHTAEGDSTATFDGRNGWMAAPAVDRPVTLTALAGGELDHAHLEAALAFPGQLKTVLKQLRTGLPAQIDDKPMDLIQGTLDGRYPVNLYFDPETGLLARVVSYADSAVGLAPTQIDYADYREAGGVKMPFRWTVTWLDGRSIITLSEVQANTEIDASRFARPTPPVTKTPEK